MKQKYLNVTAIMAVVSILLFQPAYTQISATTDWVSLNGPDGGTIKILSYASNGNLLAGTKHGGIFRSVNNGAKWSRSNVPNIDVSAFLVDASGTELAGTSDGIYRTFDNGSNWFPSNDGLTNTNIHSLFTDGHGNIYAGSSAGVFISFDNGLHWTPKFNGLYGFPVYTGMQVNTTTDTMLVGTADGVYRTTDLGESWSNFSLSGISVLSFLRTTSGLLLCSTVDSGVYRSYDGGLHWSSSGIPGITVFTIQQSPSGTLFAATDKEGIFYSTDDGDTWLRTKIDDLSVYTLQLRSSTEMFAGTLKGFYRSTNAGATWVQSNLGLHATFVNAIAADERGNIFAATEDLGMFRSTNQGYSWLQCVDTLPGGTYLSVTISSAGTIFAGHETNGLYRSTDFGRTWSKNDSGLTNSSIVQLVSHSNVILAGTAYGLFLSSDDGLRWTSINPPIGSLYVKALGMSHEGNIFASFPGYGVTFSTDMGSSWQFRNSGFFTTDIISFGFDSSGAVYAGTNSTGGLYSSSSNGIVWQSTGFDKIISSMATTPTGTLYLATKNNGVAKTNDGINFSFFSKGLTSSDINDITLTQSGALYIGTQGGGTFASSYRQFGSISGKKFFDRNRNRVYDNADTIISGWGIVLKRIITTATDTLTTTGDTTVTDNTGAYQFTNLIDGTFLVQEIPQTGWIQTYPVGRGYYLLTVKNHQAISDINFGNTRSHSFTGTGGSNWSNPANWQDGRVPQDTDAVEIPVDVLYDQTSNDTIHSLRITGGGRIQFTSYAGRLVVHNRLEIDSNSTLQFPNTDTTVILYCNGDWVDNGNFIAGNSTIIFSGDQAKVVVNNSSTASVFSKSKRTSSLVNGGKFWNLTISGDSTYTDGNVIVDNVLTLEKSLLLSTTDTLELLNGSPNAISDTGVVAEGSIKRTIDTAGVYRFESPSTSIYFSGSANDPDAITMTTYPTTHPDTTDLWYEVVGGTVNSSTNTITVDSVHHFSKWVFGRPGSGYRKTTRSTTNFVRSAASRYYAIHADGGDSFTARVTLRYEESDLDCESCEDEFQLLRGPYIVDSVYSNWNLLSAPLLTEDNDKDALFPNLTSSAFTFNGSYVAEENLTFGTGYWMKFNTNQQVAIIGDDVDSSWIPVTEGWNLVGSISLALDPADVTSSPEDIVSSSFFEYRNGYQLASDLEPMRGYWVKVSENGNLIMNARTSSQTSKIISQQDEISRLGTITLTDASGNRQMLYYGDRSVHASKYEMPPAPPTGIMNARFGSDRMAVFIDNERMKQTKLTINSAHYPVTLAWDEQQAGVAASLLIDGTTIALNKKGRYTLYNAGERVDLLLSGRPQTVPVQFALHQNYPNPFNPATTITFDLPTEQTISVSIFNILGQRVALPIDRSVYQAGSHSVQLNTANWSSGVYFYRLDAGSFTQTRKMILMK